MASGTPRAGGIGGPQGDSRAGPLSKDPSDCPQQRSWAGWGQPPPRASGTSVGTGHEPALVSTSRQGCDRASDQHPTASLGPGPMASG